MSAFFLDMVVDRSFGNVISVAFFFIIRRVTRIFCRALCSVRRLMEAHSATR